MIYTLKERFLITYRWQFRAKVFTKSLGDIYGNFTKSLYDLFCGLFGLTGSLIVQPIMTVWYYTFGYFWVTLRLKDSQLDELKNKLEAKA